MASSKTGTSTNDTFGGQYEVFLNFRGLDTRHGFTNCLKHALVDAGICVFFDDEAIRLGERLSDILLQAINDSKLYIPIFSKRYASSHWCLRELAKIIENSKSNENGKVMLPIFYDVEPDDVKLKTPVTGVGVYGEALSQLAEEKKQNSEEKKYNSEDVKTWRQALKEVGDTKGFKLKDFSGNDGDLLKAVVDEVLDRLQTRQRQEPKNLVGMKDCMTAIDKLLDIDSDDVRLIVIYGMGGIGKTTLANIIFNKLCHRFGKNCSFLGDVRETAKEKEGLVKLQKKLLSDISYFKADQNIESTYHGMNRIGETICNKKMLIVLDDVDEANQILQLIGEKYLHQGSRILVTTRDKNVLTNTKLKYEFKDYEMMGLIGKDALKLFSRHAFNEDSPPADYCAFSKGIIDTTCGLPLALQAIGSSLFGKKRELWEEWLERLQKTPHEDVLAKLKISYDALHQNEKQIFLDIACFFAGKSKTNPMYVWKACNLYPVDAIDVLINRCMIKELDNNSLWMHDQFRDLGRKIAREKRIGLWDEDDIICELRSRKNKESFEALSFSAPWDCKTITSEQIKWFPHLRILRLYEVICQGDFTGCLSDLRWIDLSYAYTDYTHVHSNKRLEATNLLHLENAVVVNLSGLDITKDVLQSLIEGARKLKVLTIRYNKLINGTPTFREDSVLEELAISSFWSLMRIDHSIGKLKWLTHLKIKSCYRLRKLPEQIGKLQNLQHLSLKSCHDLIELPDSVSKLEKLMKLDVSSTNISRLPNSIDRLRNLLFINASCTQIEELPSTMSKLCQLKTLDLRFYKIQELPKLPRSLTTLKLASELLLTVPDLSYLTNLAELFLSGRYEHRHPAYEFQTGHRHPSNEFQTGDLGWIGSLTKVSKLHICFTNVRAPTTELGSLSLLKELTLYGLDLPTFKHLPSNLIVLELYETRGIQVHLDGLPPSEKETPFLPTSLGKPKENKVSRQLDVQFLDVLESSERSCIQDCRPSESLVCQPEEPGCSGLQDPKLIDHWRGAILFPSSQKMLVKFLLSGFPEVQDIQFVTAFESLEEFYVKECLSLKSLGGLSNSKNLKRLQIHQCPSLQVVEGIEELGFLGELEIWGCRSMGRILDSSSSKIPDNCSILITGSGELPDCRDPYGGWKFDRWDCYREKILNGAEQAWSSETEIVYSETETMYSEIETVDSETETEDSPQKTNRENKGMKRKRETESAQEQGESKRGKFEMKGLVRLFEKNSRFKKYFSKDNCLYFL
ncbi:disease resistance protein RUN1-like [Eucalyptus grandis]|uniref:disease resistance protein RUN1-like n=1 Tax=Eucalyptus grandis TaxID=71139 RepID=UPI00192E8685|nr:disease resistance protein RUN1-like [Eucalyptus grandis]